MSSSKVLAALNEVIQRKATNLMNYRVNKAIVKKALSQLPKGHVSKRGGDIISKKLFVAGVAHKANLAHLPVAKQIGINTIRHDLEEGASVLRKLKKLRKNIASNRDTTMRIKFNNYRNQPEFSDVRRMDALDAKGKFLGRVNFEIKPSRVDIVDTYVNSKMRGKGVGTALFDRLAAYTQKIKRQFIGTHPSGEIRDPKMVSIRERYRTKFIGRYMGRYNEDTKVISSNVAKKLIDQADGKYRGSVSAVTDVSKKHVRFIRKNGRIIPIRIKK